MQVLFSNGKWTNLKFLVSLLLLLTLSYGDLIKTKTLACPSILILEKSMTIEMQNPLELEMYSIAHSCLILSREDKVQAIGYDPRNSKEIFQKILYKKTSTELYILRSSIQVEQGGKKNTLRF